MAAPSRLRRSTAVTESKPSSLNARAGFDRRAAVVAGDHGDLAAHQLQQRPLLLGGGERGQLRLQVAVVRRGFGLVLGDLGQRAQQRPRAGELVHRGERGPVDVRDDQVGLVVVEGLAQCLDGEFRRHLGEAHAAQQVARLGVDHAPAAPGAPGDRGRGAARGTTAAGERVEVGVARGVRGLAGGAPHGGAGGHQHERVQLGVAEQLVEQRGAGDLGPGGRGELRWGDVGQRRLGGEHAGGVHHGGRRVLVQQRPSCCSSETSQATTVTPSSSTSSRAPSASRPRRLVSTMCSAPRPASQRATCAPTAPVPPVTRTVPARPPLLRGALQRGVDHAPGEHPGRPDRDLVLTVHTGHDGAQAGRRRRGRRRRPGHPRWRAGRARRPCRGPTPPRRPGRRRRRRPPRRRRG